MERHYEPDFVVRLTSGLLVLLEVKGFENDQTKAKHQAAKRWVDAVNNWGQLGRWRFHVNRDPMRLHLELARLVAEDMTAAATHSAGASG